MRKGPVPPLPGVLSAALFVHVWHQFLDTSKLKGAGDCGTPHMAMFLFPSWPKLQKDSNSARETSTRSASSLGASPKVREEVAMRMQSRISAA